MNLAGNRRTQHRRTTIVRNKDEEKENNFPRSGQKLGAEIRIVSAVITMFLFVIWKTSFTAVGKFYNHQLARTCVILFVQGSEHFMKDCYNSSYSDTQVEELNTFSQFIEEAGTWE